MPQDKQIIRRKFEPKQERALDHLPLLLQRIYTTRSVRHRKELDRELASLLPYSKLKGISEATTLLSHALHTQQKILIVGDFDADGATSTALAVRALQAFGAKHIRFRVPNRFADGYGLTQELVAQMSIDKPDLIITVDNGIANHEGVAAAKALGMTVIITDHHLPAQILPPADAIVNPNQPEDTFPSKHLAGVGVIFYVMLALRRQLIDDNWFAAQKIAEPNMAQFLDLVALGTVADVVQLDHNNRIMVHQGLRRIRGGKCAPGIVALLELAGRDFSQAVAADLGFAVAARLNAAGRLDDMSLGITCLLNDDAMEARALAQRLNQLNHERRSIEQDMQTQALEVVHQLNLEKNGELPRGLCLFDESWHQGVIGILASRIKERFHRPVIVFAPGLADELKGSARSITGLHIRDTLALIDVQYPKLINKFGGHAMAAGLTINKQLLNKFMTIFNEVVSKQITEAHLQHILLSDGELSAVELSLEIADLIRDGGPWGQAFPEPVFDDEFIIHDQRLVGDKHLKLSLEKENVILDGIAFFVDTQIWPNHRCQKIKAAYRLDVNQYKGRRSVQLIIDYFKAIDAS